MPKAKSETLPIEVMSLVGAEAFATAELGTITDIVNDQIICFRGKIREGDTVWYWTTADVHQNVDALFIVDGGRSRTHMYAGQIMNDGENQTFKPNFPSSDYEIERGDNVDMQHFSGTIEIVILGDGRVFLPKGRESEYPALMKSAGY